MELRYQKIALTVRDAGHILLKEHPTMTVALLVTFMEVVKAGEAGISPTELSRNLGIPKVTASSRLLTLSVQGVRQKPGLDLLNRGTSDTNLTELKYTLSDKGKALMDAIAEVWRT